MNSRETKRVVSMVLRARMAKESDEEITARLVDAGFTESDAISVLDSIDKGFKHGTLSVVTCGLSSADLPFGEDPFFDLSFRKGRSAMRWTTPGWVLVRMVLPWAVVLAVIVGVLYMTVK